MAASDTNELEALRLKLRQDLEHIHGPLLLAKPSLLVLDDFGIGEIDPLSSQFMLELVDRRQRTGSLLITSQYPTEKWHAFFPNPTVADAVLDRIVHKAHRISLNGESMRKVMTKQMFQAV